MGVIIIFITKRKWEIPYGIDNAMYIFFLLYFIAYFIHTVVEKNKCTGNRSI